MAEFPSTVTRVSAGAVTVQPPESLVSTTLVIYALYALSCVTAVASFGFPPGAFLFGILGIAGVVLAYVKRSDAAGSWLESHYRWLIRTFWFSLLWAAVGWILLILLALVLVGFVVGPLVWLASTIWVIYRVIKGYVVFREHKPIS